MHGSIWHGDLTTHRKISISEQTFLILPILPKSFSNFVDNYIDKLNASYIDVTSIDEPLICRESVHGYNQISDTLGIHRPPHYLSAREDNAFHSTDFHGGRHRKHGTFLLRIHLNGDLLPSQYPATYAHELAHLLGITSEAEANFYAYQVCTRSQVKGIRFCGYLFRTAHVLGNARRLMTEEEYAKLFNGYVLKLLNWPRRISEYWMKKYSP